jgi:hypothetical protein
MTDDQACFPLYNNPGPGSKALPMGRWISKQEHGPNANDSLTVVRQLVFL